MQNGRLLSSCGKFCSWASSYWLLERRLLQNLDSLLFTSNFRIFWHRKSVPLDKRESWLFCRIRFLVVQYFDYRGLKFDYLFGKVMFTNGFLRFQMAFVRSGRMRSRMLWFLTKFMPERASALCVRDFLTDRGSLRFRLPDSVWRTETYKYKTDHHLAERDLLSSLFLSVSLLMGRQHDLTAKVVRCVVPGFPVAQTRLQIFLHQFQINNRKSKGASWQQRSINEKSTLEFTRCLDLREEKNSTQCSFRGEERRNEIRFVN